MSALPSRSQRQGPLFLSREEKAGKIRHSFRGRHSDSPAPRPRLPGANDHRWKQVVRGESVVATYPQPVADPIRATVPGEATPPASHGDYDAMARRRFQNPSPERIGKFWYVRIRQDHFENGRTCRKLVRLKIAPASMLEREVKKIAAELIRPTNQGLITIGSAVNFSEYVQSEYIPTVLPLLATSTQESYEIRIAKYLQ